MSEWENAVRVPEGLVGPGRFREHFAAVADRLLNKSRLVVANQPHRLVEVEVYWHGPNHPDPFAHCDPVQLETGRWYFHRTGGVYRSGSFKGLDFSFGHPGAYGGVLLRGLEKADGTLIDGPSLLVDYLIDLTGAGTVAALDKVVAGRRGWEADNIIALADSNDAPRPVVHSGRVGLSLKRMRSELAQQYILKPYRYLTEPRRTAKGKAYLILSLYAQGLTAEAVRELTGSGRSTVERYLADYEAGRSLPDFSPFFGKDLTPADLCRLHGKWHAAHGTGDNVRSDAVGERPV